MEDVLKLFVLGVTVSFGPCVAHCSVVILPYIAATARGWRGGLRAILVFSGVRLLVYGTLGLLAGLLGQVITAQLVQFEGTILVAGGMFIASLGLFVVLRKNKVSQCSAACRPKRRTDVGGSALLGLFSGVLPCLPLLGVLTFAVLYANGPWEGALFGLAFGAGKIFSPLTLLGVLAGGAPTLLKRYGHVFGYFAKICGVVLVFIGMSLVIPRLFG